MTALTNLHGKRQNTVAARHHQLHTCKQQVGESIDTSVVRLKRLNKECSCEEITAEQYRLDLAQAL